MKLTLDDVDRRLHEMGVECVYTRLFGVRGKFTRPDLIPLMIEWACSGEFDSETNAFLIGALWGQDAKPYRKILKQLLVDLTTENERIEILHHLGRSSRKSEVDELWSWLEDESMGGARVILVRHILRLGGDEAAERLEAFRGHPDFGPEVTDALHRRARRKARAQARQTG